MKRPTATIGTELVVALLALRGDPDLTDAYHDRPGWTMRPTGDGWTAITINDRTLAEVEPAAPLADTIQIRWTDPDGEIVETRLERTFPNVAHPSGTLSAPQRLPAGPSQGRHHQDPEADALAGPPPGRHHEPRQTTGPRSSDDGIREVTR